MSKQIAVTSPCRFACLLAVAVCLSATESMPDEPDKAIKAVDDSMVGKKAGQVRDDNGLKMKLVWCSPGIFAMENIDYIEQPAAEEKNQPVERR